MKKSLLLSLPLVACLSLIASCGETSSSSSAAGIITDPTTITLWSTIGQANRSTIESIIEDFKKVEPNVTINNVYKSSSYNELKDEVVKGFSADNYPDIVQCYPDHVAEYLDYNKAVNLDSYMSNATYGWSKEDREDIVPAFLTEGEEYAQEGIYSVPFCKSTEAMFYNEDVLIGLDLSAIDNTINGGKALNASYLNNLTWEELFGKLCPAIVTYNDGLAENAKILKTDQAYHGVFGYDSDDNLFITLSQQYGYGYTSVDKTTGNASVDFVNDGMKNLMKTFNDAYKKGYIITKASSGNNYTNTFFTTQNTLFSVGSTGGVKYQFSEANPMNVGVAMIPQAKDAKAKKVISQGPSLTVLDHSDSNRSLASWLFYKFLANEKNSLAWAIDSGYMPIRSSGYESNEYLEQSDISNKTEKTLDLLKAKSFTYCAEAANAGYTTPSFKGSSACRTQAASIMTQCLTSDLTDTKLSSIFETAYNNCIKAM